MTRLRPQIHGSFLMVWLLSSATLFAQDQTKSDELSLAYVPRDALIVAAGRPSEALSQPIFAPLKKALDQQDGLRELYGISVTEIDHVVGVLLPRDSRGGIVAPGEGGMVVHLNKDTDREALLKVWLRKAEQKEFAGQTYFINSSRRRSCYFASDRTVVLSESEAIMRRFIIAGKRGASKAKWADAWQRVSAKHAAFMLDIERLRPGLDAEFRSGREQIVMAPIAPLWQHGVHLVAGVTAGTQIDLQISVICNGDDGATNVADTLNAVVILARNTLSSLRSTSTRLNEKEAILELRAADLADEVLDGLKFQTEKNVVNVSATVGSEAEELIAWLLPAVTEAKVANKRTQSKNNLKQIGLAMHNYHAAYLRFPPAVVIGPDGKTPHSWRVEILPFLDQLELYEQYRMDEPWDSEHNKQLLEQIPDQYRCPEDDAFTTNSSYFALVGKGTVFENEKGQQIRDVIDGTSNTVMVVESKKAVPWTKPEDIPIDFSKDLPKFGGFYDKSPGFNVLFCDGAVRFISSTIDPEMLKRVMQRNDGQVVEIP